MGDSPTSSSSSGFIAPEVETAPVEPDSPDEQEYGNARRLAMPPQSRRGQGKGRSGGAGQQVRTYIPEIWN